MTISRRLLLISLICGTAALGIAQSVQPPFTLSLTAVSPSVRAGTDVWVKIQLTNKTQHDLSAPVVDTNGVDTGYQYDVRVANGDLAAKVANAHPEIQIGSFKSRVVKPGASTGWEEVRVSKVYDMSRPGEYVIQVARPVSGKAEDGVVKSNTITVTVTE